MSFSDKGIKKNNHKFSMKSKNYHQITRELSPTNILLKAIEEGMSWCLLKVMEAFLLELIWRLDL